MSWQVHVMVMWYHWISVTRLWQKNNGGTSDTWSKIIWNVFFFFKNDTSFYLQTRLICCLSLSPLSPPFPSSSISWLLPFCTSRGRNKKQSERWVIFSFSTLTWFMSNTAPIKQCPDQALVLSPTADWQALTYSNSMEAPWHPSMGDELASGLSMIYTVSMSTIYGFLRDYHHSWPCVIGQ